MYKDVKYAKMIFELGTLRWFVAEFFPFEATRYHSLFRRSTDGAAFLSSADGPAQPEVAATCKHLIAYDHSQGYTDAKVDAKNLYESYIPGWEGCAGPAAKSGADAMSVMCSCKQHRRSCCLACVSENKV